LNFEIVVRSFLWGDEPIGVSGATATGGGGDDAAAAKHLCGS